MIQEERNDGMFSFKVRNRIICIDLITLKEPVEQIVFPDNVTKVFLDEEKQKPMYGVKVLVFGKGMECFTVKKWMFPDIEEIVCDNTMFSWDAINKTLYCNEEEELVKCFSNSDKPFKMKADCRIIDNYAFEGTKFSQIDFSDVGASHMVYDIRKAFAGSEWIKKREEMYFIVNNVVYPVRDKVVIEEFEVPKDCLISRPESFQFHKLILKEFVYYNFCKAFVQKVVVKKNDITSKDIVEIGGLNGVEEIQVCSEYFQSIDGVVYSADGKELIRYPAYKKDISFTVPDRVMSINSAAFREVKNLKTLYIADSVQYIGKNAFDNSYIEEISFSKGMTMIESSLFALCTRIKKIRIPGNIRYISSTALSSDSIQEIEMEEGVEHIGYMAFGTSGLKTALTLPKTAIFLSKAALVGVRELIVQNYDTFNLIEALDGYHPTIITTSWDEKKYFVPGKNEMEYGYIGMLNDSWNKKKFQEEYKNIGLKISGKIKKEYDLFNYLNEHEDCISDIDSLKRHAKSFVLRNMKENEAMSVKIIKSDLLTKAGLKQCLEKAQNEQLTTIIAYLTERLQTFEKQKAFRI